MIALPREVDFDGTGCIACATTSCRSNRLGRLVDPVSRVVNDPVGTHGTPIARRRQRMRAAHLVATKKGIAMRSPSRAFHWSLLVVSLSAGAATVRQRTSIWPRRGKTAR